MVGVGVGFKRANLQYQLQQLCSLYWPFSLFFVIYPYRILFSNPTSIVFSNHSNSNFSLCELLYHLIVHHLILFHIYMPHLLTKNKFIDGISYIPLGCWARSDFVIYSLCLFAIYFIEVKGSLKAEMLCQLALNSSRAYHSTLHREIQYILN